MAKWFKWTLIGIALLVFGSGLYVYWGHQARYPTTNDAYVQAHVVRIAPQIAGRVTEVFTDAHRRVRAGQALLVIDPEPFQIALAQAEAELDSARQAVAADEAAVAAAQAKLDQQSALLTEAEQNARRTLALVRKKVLPPSSGDTARDALDAARATKAAAQSELELARRSLGEPGVRNSRLRAAAAVVAQARLDLAHTSIAAPADGVVADFSTRPGDVVKENVPLFALVESREWWVDANYKETDLLRIAPGQHATITVDMYPRHTFSGVVESISPASGVAFSLLPPENATGNWVKVTQRFPVRVRIMPLGSDPPLRIGASAKVTIDTVANGAGKAGAAR